MASSGNFASINFQAQSTISQVDQNETNLTFNGSSLSPANYNAGVVCDFGMKGGKWYWELYLHGGGSPSGGIDWSVGFAPYSTASKSIDEGTYGLDLGNGSSATLSGYSFTHVNGSSTGIRHNNSTDTSLGLADHTSGDVLGFALDLEAGTWIIYRNGSSLGTVATGIDTTLTYFASVGAVGGTVSDFDVTLNFGQDSTFKGAVSAGGNADENGFGDFKYSVPSGYLACCSGNLEISSDIDPAQTDDDYPSKQFNVITFTGTGSSRTISGLGLQPDLIWAKRRDGSRRHYLVDSNRGFTKYLHSEDTYSEGTSSDGVTSANSDGFVIGGSLDYINANSNTYVAWCWRANGGTTVSNSEGSITATVQANTKAGFSIATYQSPNSGTNHTVGHGLSGVDFIITKNRDQSFNWYCFHKSSPNYTYRLNSGSRHSYSNWSMGATTWGSEEGYTTNGSQNWVAYCWQNVVGMQHFGSYVGNGNTDGPFVYTGFRPRLIFTLLDNSTSGWRVRDTARSTFNPTDKIVWWNREDQEYSTSGYNFDIFSNGFKVTNTGSDFNTSGSTYFYGAWADVPAKYNNTF